MIKNLKVNDEINDFFIINNVEEKKTSKGSPYLSIVFGDKSGKITGNLWNSTEKDKENFKNGSIVLVNGSISEYNGNKQIKISNMRTSREGDSFQENDLIESSFLTPEQIEKNIYENIDKIKNEKWKNIVLDIFNKFKSKFIVYPAAVSNHHAFKGGLGEHTISILNSINSLGNNYKDADISLLISGAILHDMGKVIELSGDSGTKYTIPGNLIGHISLVNEQIVLAVNDLGYDLNDEDLILLRHVVLSHHGKLEWGSPVSPQILEAEILHYLDDLDAKINMINSSNNSTEENNFGKRIFGLDNRKFLNTSANKNPII